MPHHDLDTAHHMAEAAEGEPDRSLRDRFNDFIARHAAQWEIAFALLAVVYVGLDLAFDTASGSTAQAVDGIEIGLTLVFAAEFFSRILASRERAKYLRDHLIDVVALLPPVRALRVLRVLRLVRIVSGFYRASMGYAPLARHRGFLSLVVAWLTLGALSSLAFYAAEHGANSSVKSPVDALWWGVGSLTTVGSDLFPTTLEGRFAAMALMLIGVFLLAAITATITSVLLSSKRPDEGIPLGIAQELEHLSDLRTEATSRSMSSPVPSSSCWAEAQPLRAERLRRHAPRRRSVPE